MSRKLLNLGILAHVDAGKTTLTERLLHAAGVIDAVGSVDRGTTQTDTLALERQRGITIKAAVVSFPIDDVTVNLIDTPGHPDFIAEVERVLGVLDGVVLVVSAVEGVQPQTRVLWRALRRLRLPTLVFLNKIDRAGADVERVVRALRELTGPVGIVEPGGSPLEALAERDEALLAAFVNGTTVPEEALRAALVEQTRHAEVVPVFVGSALRGIGVEELMRGIAELLPPAGGEADGPAAGTVFKVERGPHGEKVAYVRLFSGALHARDRVGEQKVTAVSVFADGRTEQRRSVHAGEIAKVWGLPEIRIGDQIGASAPPVAQFAPPTLEAVVVPRDPADAHALSVALTQLAEQDPLIDVRNDGGVLSLSLYGEVQKEVVEATLAADYGLAVEFRETKTIHVERPIGAGEALEVLNAPTNPYNAEVGLRIEPGAEGSGVEFRLDVATRWLPLYVYKRREFFEEGMSRYVRAALRNGLHGWRVTDCVVTMTRCDYPLADGPPSKRGSLAMPRDYEGLTPLVLRHALERAGTVVCEPLLHLELAAPAAAVGGVLRVLARLGATVAPPAVNGRSASVTALAPAARVPELQRLLPGLTSGEGALESAFAGYRPVTGEPPKRA